MSAIYGQRVKNWLKNAATQPQRCERKKGKKIKQMKGKMFLAALLLSACATTRTSNVMEMANGNYVVNDRSSSGTAESYAAAHDEAQAFCQHKALRPVVVGTRPFHIVPSNQRDIYSYSYGVSRFSSGGGTVSVGGATLAFRCT